MKQLRAMKRGVRLAAGVFVFASISTSNAVGAQTLSAAPSDSIVKLAVDGATRAGVPAVTLLDEMEMHLEANGTGTRRYRTVTQFLNDQAARARAEQSFGYAPGHQKLTLNWVRVLKPTGEVISDKPAQTQDADVPAAMQNPVYQDQKIRRLSLGGVANGTILDISWTIEEKAPYRSGDFYDRWSVNNGSEVIRSLLVVNMPETYQPRIIEKNLNFKRTEKVADKHRTLTWATSNVERVRGEPFAADSNDVLMSVTIAPPGSWGDIAKWYSGLAKDRYTLTPDIAKRVDSVVAAAKPHARIDTLRAIHRWVAQDVRYVSVSLGMGGYQPRAPEQVLATGFGDCKDKATLVRRGRSQIRNRCRPGAALEFRRVRSRHAVDLSIQPRNCSGSQRQGLDLYRFDCRINSVRCHSPFISGVAGRRCAARWTRRRDHVSARTNRLERQHKHDGWRVEI